MMDIFRLARSRLAGILPDTRGNTTMVFGLCLVPLIVMAGLGVDYGTAMANKTKLDAAADAAVIAGVATAKAYIASNQGDPNAVSNAVAEGKSRAINAFYVNAGNVPFTQFTVSAPDVSFSGQTFSASITYQASTVNHFGNIVGIKTFDWTGKSVAVADVPNYLDFYLLLDVSGSMGLPSTQEGMDLLASMNHDMFGTYKQGCVFACHYPNMSGWNLSQKYHIQLRSGAVNSAVCKLLKRAASPAVPNQYRIGLYPFVTQMGTLAALTGDIASLSGAADCDPGQEMAFTNLLDTGYTQLATNNDPGTGTGAGGTHFETTLSQIQSTVVSYGDGSSAKTPKPFIFIVTDGMQNSQHYRTWVGRYTYPGSPSRFPGYADATMDGSRPKVMDYTQCKALRDAGATISILYIPYLQIQFVDHNDLVSQENAKVNAFSPNLPNALRQCANPGYFYTANTPQDITNALNAMFDQAVQMAHLKQ